MKYTFNFKNSKEESLIYLILREKDIKLKISTNIKGDPKYWDAKSQTMIGCPDAKYINIRLARWKEAVEKILCLPFSEHLTIWDVRDELACKMTDRGYDPALKKDLLLPFYKEWATTSTTTHTATRHTYYRYRVFEEFIGHRRITFQTLTQSVIDSFVNWMAKEKGFSPNTRGSQVKDLKAVMAYAERKGIECNQAYKKVKKEKEEVDAVYLTDEELQKLEDLELYGRRAGTRDLFLIGCYTAMRFSDYSRLTRKDITDGFIHQTQQKTKERVIIPVHPKVQEILDRNPEGIKIPMAEFNRLIKIICMDAGINGIISITKNGVTSNKEKWEMVSSHTARRTAATNMYKAGIPPIDIMKITGHKSETTFMQYIRITKEETARRLANSVFFQKKGRR